MLHAVHRTYVCVLVIYIALCTSFHSASTDYVGCSVTSHVCAWPLYEYLTGPSTIMTKETDVFGWCPGSAMGVHPEAGGVDAHSVLGMCQLEPNWWVQSGAGECKGLLPCTASSPYNSRAAMQLRSCMRQTTHRCIYICTGGKLLVGGFVQILCREMSGD